jgi:RNA polymerase sigma-70 factor (ECF subfamily)
VKGGVEVNTKACLSDEDIISLYFARSERAIAETENKYGRLLYTVAFRCVGDAGWARECQNDRYLAVWNRIPPEHPKNLQAFLTAIIRNLAVNRYKKESAQGRIPTAMTVAMQDLEFVLPSGDAPVSAP